MDERAASASEKPGPSNQEVCVFVGSPAFDASIFFGILNNAPAGGAIWPLLEQIIAATRPAFADLPKAVAFAVIKCASRAPARLSIAISKVPWLKTAANAIVDHVDSG